MAEITWITVFFPTPLIFRYHLPLIEGMGNILSMFSNNILDLLFGTILFTKLKSLKSLRNWETNGKVGCLRILTNFLYVVYSTLLHLPSVGSTVPEDAGIEPSSQIHGPWPGGLSWLRHRVVVPSRHAAYRMACRYDNPMSKSTISHSGTMNLATGLLSIWHWQWDALTTRLDLIHSAKYNKLKWELCIFTVGVHFTPWNP